MAQAGAAQGKMVSIWQTGSLRLQQEYHYWHGANGGLRAKIQKKSMQKPENQLTTAESYYIII